MPKIYGLPKIHKAGIPLRPVTSTINSPNSFLAKKVVKILEQAILKPKSYVKNSFDLLEKTQNLVIPDDHILISLDVRSLFTNVTKDLVLSALDKIYNIINRKCKVPFCEIIDTVNFLFDNTYFISNGNIYR